MSVEELNNKFNKWNPMENDYNNTEFNHYVSGPGADLDSELQPAQQALQRSGGHDTVNTELVPTLLFKYLPKDMTKRAMYNICSKHGSVREVRDSTKNDYYFVDAASVSDMEAILRGLENNNYGFKIIIAKSQSKKKQLDKEINQKQESCSVISQKKNGIDYESRSYRTSEKYHPRPKVQEESLLNGSDVANTGLPLKLIINDAHNLERQGLYKIENNKFNYRHGRSYVRMPEKTKQFIEQKHKESAGAYHDSEDKYVHKTEDHELNNIGKCSQCYYACDTVCERCSEYYCSVECQKANWACHRYICGKPKHLQKTPPSQKEQQVDNSSITPKTSNRATAIETSKTIEVNTIKGTSSAIPQKSSKIIPKQLRQFRNDSSQKLLKTSETSQQVSYSVKTSQQNQNSAETSSQQLSTSLKPCKKLPAALRATLKQPQNSSEESSQHQTSSKASPQQFSKPSTVSPNDSNKNLGNAEYIYKQNMPRSGNIVTITAISKTNVVFIRSTTYDDNLSYFSTLDTLQSIGSLLHPLTSLPKSGEVVIAKFEEQFNRALVLKAFDPTKISIHFMDYGNIEQAKMEDLFEAPKELVYKPRHAIPVLLKDVNDCYMTEEIRKFMHFYLNNINVEIRYKPEDFHHDNNVYAVELIDENTQQNLNKMIMKLSKPVEPQNINEICNNDYLERKTLPVGRNVELIVMDNSLMCSGCISCTTKAYAVEIEKFKRDIQAYVESIPKEPYTPRVDELCIARYNEDGLWYRGLCLETVGDGYPSIHFIDYGNITIVPIESIRRYPRQFTYPIYTFDCAIEGMPEFCDDELVAKLENLIPNGELIKCENVTVDVESNFYILSLPNVNRELSKH